MKANRPAHLRRAGAITPQQLWLLGYVAGAVAMAAWLRTKAGVWGIPLGLMLGVIAVHFGVHFLLWFSEMAWRGRPPMPDCRRGRCGGDDFFIERQNGRKTYLCRCRFRYRRKGLSLIEITPEGKELPFLRWRPFRGWFPDFKL